MRLRFRNRNRLFDAADGGEGGGGNGGSSGDDKGKSSVTDEKGGKPSDKEAELLKEVMKRKEKEAKLANELKALGDQNAELNKKLQQFDGINVEEVRKLLEAKKAQDEDAALKRGEFDRLKSQMVDEHNKALTSVKTESEKVITELTQKLGAATNQIVDLTIGRAFGDSQFVLKDLTMTPAKARVVFGPHFELQDGRVVGFDKPAGAQNRTMLVDGSGDPLPFDKALAKIVDADADRDQLLRSKMKGGSGSNTVSGAKPTPELGSGRERIKAGLASGGFKLDGLVKK